MTSTRNRIGVGIIGASPGPNSWAANTHVPALQALPEYDLRAVSTSRRESADAATAAWGVTGYDHAHGVIEHPGVDLVVVAVKVPDHAALIAAALTAGKMVYSEWPLGTDLDQAIHLVELAEHAGVRTVIGLQGRYAPAVRHARDLVRAGEIGDVLATTLVGSGVAWGAATDRRHAYLYDAANGATTLTAAALHALDALIVTLGPIRTVTATTAVRQTDVRLVEDGATVTVTAADHVAVTGTLDDGAVLSAFYRGGVSRDQNLRWEITGSHGEIVITSATPGNGNLQAVDLRIAAATRTDPAFHELVVPEAHSPAPVSGLSGPSRNVAELYRQFADDLDTGRTSVPDFGYALDRHRLVDAIETADRDGRSQILPRTRADVAAETSSTNSRAGAADRPGDSGIAGLVTR